ncbi:hypothetical protein AADX40_15260 [Aeromonas veronii]|uniref:hypothetical protein n=1 Tax=Aeromonas veronii TaxID=654 RepID=UPI0031591409
MKVFLFLLFIFAWVFAPDFVLSSSYYLWEVLKSIFMEHYWYVTTVAATLLLVPLLMELFENYRRNKILKAWRRKIRLTHKFAEKLAYRGKQRG